MDAHPLPWTLTARWLFPVDRPPLERGTVTIAGERLVAVEPHGVRTADADLGNVALLPGLVNAHTHLDLSGMRGKCPPTDPDHFTDWLQGVIAYRRSRPPDRTPADIGEGVSECLRFGITLVGDITASGQSWDVLSASPMRAVVFHEMIGLTEERAAAAGKEAGNWVRNVVDTPTCRKGFSPHAPYSVRASLFCGATGPEDRLSIHFAESAAELQLLRTRTGPFVDFLTAVGAWDPRGLAPNHPYFLVRSRGAAHALFIHCNYMPLEWCRYIAKQQTIVYCPRTHAAFGHPPHPFRDFLARGVRVALGTDSLASNPDLDLLAEARFVHRKHPDVSGAALLRMATLSGAEALGWADETGSLTVGKSADLVVLPLPDEDASDPHALLFASERAVEAVLFRGGWTYRAPAKASGGR